MRVTFSRWLITTYGFLTTMAELSFKNGKEKKKKPRLDKPDDHSFEPRKG